MGCWSCCCWHKKGRYVIERHGGQEKECGGGVHHGWYECNILCIVYRIGWNSATKTTVLDIVPIDADITKRNHIVGATSTHHHHHHWSLIIMSHDGGGGGGVYVVRFLRTYFFPRKYSGKGGGSLLLLRWGGTFTKEPKVKKSLLHHQPIVVDQSLTNARSSRE